MICIVRIPLQVKKLWWVLLFLGHQVDEVVVNVQIFKLPGALWGVLAFYWYFCFSCCFGGWVFNSSSFLPDLFKAAWVKSAINTKALWRYLFKLILLCLWFYFSFVHWEIADLIWNNLWSKVLTLGNIFPLIVLSAAIQISNAVVFSL